MRDRFQGDGEDGAEGYDPTIIDIVWLVMSLEASAVASASRLAWSADIQAESGWVNRLAALTEPKPRTLNTMALACLTKGIGWLCRPSLLAHLIARFLYVYP